MNFYDKEPQLLKKERSKLRDHISKGMTAFLVLVAGMLFFFAIFRISSIVSAIGKILGVLSPIIYGFVIAFLLNPLVKVIERFLKPMLKVILRKEQRAQKAARGISILISLLVFVAVIVALLNMLIPEVYKSIKDLVDTLPAELRAWGEEINTILAGNTTLDNIIKTLLIEGNKALQEWVANDLVKWVQTDLLKQTNTFIVNLTTGVISVISAVLNILIGFIVSIYVMFSKEKFASQGKKCIYAVFSPRRANIILHIVRKANEIFSGFIVGKIIDSAIMGVLCFIGLSILQMPYALLVSVIVGITNVIPFFGPYLGAIPSAILITLVDPMKGLYFIIFILLLQQLDGNIIGPKILGDSTGLSSFWVITSILVAGGLFGVPGMIMGVPSFALIYYIVKMFVQQKLEQKNLPTSTACYTEENYVDEDGTYVSSDNDNETPKAEETEDANSSTE